ncbi:MAG: potassium transporter TrkH [Phycisphaerae bacterium]|nr:MAG: potassium transporter TrkH [Phycisphaerae bacterium]
MFSSWKRKPSSGTEQNSLSRYRRTGISRLSAPQLFVLSFAGLVLFGTLGLKLLPGLYTDESLGWLDALFTATSAVCVTGLIVVDTSTYFTLWGQAFLLLLFQLGGLGILSFTSLILVSLGKRLSLRHETVTMNTAEIAPHVEQKHLLRNVILFTFGIEAVGALLLYLCTGPQVGWREAIWPAIFHSVSAFCNAGFSTNSDSLMQIHSNIPALWIISLLIIAGGIGFLTLEELYLLQREKRRGKRFRISLHSRLVLVTTAVLIVSGIVVFFLLEWNHTFRDMPMIEKFHNALFMSAAARTAGFNTIDYSQATVGTNFFTILLMSIGGAPASTAGGLKVTTLAIIALVAWSRIRGRTHTSIADRTIPESTIQRAIGLFAIVFSLMTLSIFALCIGITQDRGNQDFLAYMFEAVSAFNTVGLSMGVTSSLSNSDRILTICLMFVGRVGPLVFAAALTPRRDTSRCFRYAHEDVMVG